MVMYVLVVRTEFCRYLICTSDVDRVIDYLVWGGGGGGSVGKMKWKESK